MKRKYTKLSMEVIELQPQGCILTGSVDSKQVLVEKDFNIYTDSYEDKTFDWDTQSFK